MKTIVRIEFGSHLYGTNTPTSDHDWKTVHIPNAEDILLQKVAGSTGHTVIRPEGEKNTPEDVDDESYSLQKYLSLLAEGQTVAIDMLFAPKPIVTSDLWARIKDNKDKFLTKKSASFVRYCRTQANKYGIKGSRVAAAKRAKEFFDLHYSINPQMKVGECFFEDETRNIELQEFTRIVTKETSPGKNETYFECCNRMVGFKNTVKEARTIFTRIYEEYGNRSRLAESNEGIDWKALSHAVRVGYEALDLLNNHEITFPLDYAPHLLAIKTGKVPYKLVAEEIEGLLDAVEDASAKSTLADEPDYNFIDNLVKETYAKEVVDWYHAAVSYHDACSLYTTFNR